MTEYTVTFDAEITIIAKEDDDCCVDWPATEKHVAELLNADDVHITNGKVFISKEGVE